VRITFVIGSLEAGGAQRVLILLSEGLVKRGHQVTVLTINGLETDCFSLPDSVERKALNLSTRWQVLLKFLKLRAAIISAKPDVIVSFIERVNIMTLLSTRGLGIPVVVSERSAPEDLETHPFWNWMRAWVYLFSSRIILQSQGALDYFLPTFQGKAVIVPNPVVAPPETSLPRRTLTQPMMLSVGRLHAVKQFDRLISAFAMLKDKHPDWILTIAGDGSLKNKLEKLGQDLELGDRLHLPGYVKSPYALLRQADLFVMTSRVEGFPNALCEAMACGLPVISTDCPSGPREIIRDGVDGILVQNDDIAAVSAAMDHLMSDEAERKRLASRSIEIVKRFDLDKVIHIWESILTKVIESQK